MTLPIDVEFAASYLDGVMEHENPEIAREWKTIRDHLASIAESSEAISDILAERVSHVAEKGWTPEHDDRHDDGSLALAAALYATPIMLHQVHVGSGDVTWTDPWPWTRPTWAGREQDGDPMTGRINEGDGRTKHDRRRQLVIAGSLIVAEIERLDRASAPGAAEAA